MGGDSSTPQAQQVTTNTSNLPEYAQPYFQDIMGQAQALTNTQTNPYTPYSQQRIAQLTPGQQQTNASVMGMQTPTGFGSAENTAQQAGLAALNAGQNYTPGSFNAQTVNPYNAQGVANVNAPGGVANVQAQQYDPNGAAMQAAQSNYQGPNLTTFQMGPSQDFGQTQADQYMSPYIQKVLDTTMSQNLRNAQQDQLAGNLNAGRLGTLGGSRQLIASTERERNLGQLQASTEAQGLQSAYSNAQQQFNADRAAQQNVGQTNLQAQLGVQALGSQNSMQMAMANLSNQQQAAVQNQAAYLQTQGLNAQQALQAALANQQSGLTTQGQGLQAALANQQSGLTTQGLNAQQSLAAQQANQQAGLQAQQYGEQSRQFGANLGLQGLAQATQSAATLGSLGAQQQSSDLARYQAQSAVGSQQQQLNQQLLDQQYQDFLTQKAYPEQQLSYYSSILHGVPVTPDQTQTMYGTPPSATSQIAGLGLGALGLYNLASGSTTGKT